MSETSVVWAESFSVTPQAGLFTLTLGATAPIDPALFSDNLDLVVTVEADTLEPIALSSVPYAMRAGTAEFADNADSADSYVGPVDWSQLINLPADLADGTDSDTTYSAGAGLTLVGTTFSADPAVLQARVAGACPSGEAIRAIAGDGSVACEPDTSVSYDAGIGLTLSGTTFSANPAVLQTRVSTTCNPGQSIREIAEDGAVTCEDDTDTTYLAGTGLGISGTTFSVDTSAIQARVSGTCAANEAVRTINVDGTVVCEADSDTTYSASTGLSLSGTTFSVDTSAIQARVSGSCPAGESIRTINVNGTVVCEVDSGANYSAGSGLSLGGTTFSVDTSVIQARISGACAANEAVRTINADGTVVCEADRDTTYSASTGLSLSGTTFSVNTSVIQARISGTCAVGQFVRAIASDGTVTCGDAVRSSAGSAQRICTGSTPLGSTSWNAYSATGIFVDVDTSACGFASTPRYLVNVHGDSGSWMLTGGSSAYARTATGFRLYVRYSNDAALTPATANSVNWHVVWMGAL